MEWEKLHGRMAILLMALSRMVKDMDPMTTHLTMVPKKNFYITMVLKLNKAKSWHNPGTINIKIQLNSNFEKIIKVDLVE